MLGIRNIGYYLPQNVLSNFDRMEEFEIDEKFIEKRLGVKQITQKNEEDDTSDLCVKAFESLMNKSDCPDKKDIEVLVVVTQTPDMGIPHSSALVHGKLDLPDRCACFDISLGCSGFPYALSIIQAFMQANGMKNGLLFTSDPYSKIVDPKDRATSMIFGDGAAVSWIAEDPVFVSGKFTFGTQGQHYEALQIKEEYLYMNGRAVANFASKIVPEDVAKVIKDNDLNFDDIDKFIFHQGSRYIVEKIAKMCKAPLEKVIFDIEDYGNTISSSIPIMLAKEIEKESRNYVIIGFGVGLSWSSTVLRRTK